MSTKRKYPTKVPLCEKVKSVQIRSFFWSVFSRILSTRKYRPEKTLYLNTFHTLCSFILGSGLTNSGLDCTLTMQGLTVIIFFNYCIFFLETDWYYTYSQCSINKPPYIDLILTNKPQRIQLACVIDFVWFLQYDSVIVMKTFFEKLQPRLVNYRDCKYFENDRFRTDFLSKLGKTNEKEKKRIKWLVQCM